MFPYTCRVLVCAVAPPNITYSSCFPERERLLVMEETGEADIHAI